MRTRLMIVAVASVFVAQAANRGAAAGPEDAKALKYFVGNWIAQDTDKPSKFVPDGGKREVHQSIAWTLKERFIVGREVRLSDGGKSLWLMTYDPKSKSYPFWFFDNRGVLGGEWNSTWDDATRTLTGKATDTPAGWTSNGVNHFPDANSDEVAVWMKDDAGTVMFDSESKKTRQPDKAGEKILATWSKVAKNNPDAPQSPEMKVLERMIGDWDTTNHSKAAVWTPEEKRWTSKVSRKWVLDGHFVEDASEDSDGRQGYSLITFDPQAMAYRSWWFSSEGYTAKASGTWDAASESFAFKSDLDGGLTSRTTWKFSDKDHHEVKVVVTDGDGKVYFDTTWTVTRRKQ